MSRIMKNRSTGVMAIVDWTGRATFHDEAGWPIQLPEEGTPQDAMIEKLEAQGYEDVTGAVL